MPAEDPFARDSLPEDPLPVLEAWLDRAVRELRPHNPTAMTLASVDADGAPDARMVICRGYDAGEGWLVFYTDSTSAKGRQLATRPQAALVFHWDALQRQVRVRGPVRTAPDAQADGYFAGRPLGSQLAAWTSSQSAPLASRGALDQRYRKMQERFGAAGDPNGPGSVPRPPHWWGYRVWAEQIEFWAGRPSRLHERACYTRKLEERGDGFVGGPWTAARLWP